MSRSTAPSEFRFSKSRDEELTASSTRYDIHPMELVVQSLLGGPLEGLSNHLQTLHESQVVLMARLKIMEEKLRKYSDQLSIDFDVKDTNDRLHALKKKLTKIQATLKLVEKRLAKLNNGVK